MKQIALSEIKDDFSRFLHEAAVEQIVITRHGRPAGILVGFANEDDWFDYRLEHDPGFLDRIAAARDSIKTGLGVKMEDLQATLKQPPKRRAPKKHTRALPRNKSSKTPAKNS